MSKRHLLSLVAGATILLLGCSEIHAQVGSTILGGGGKTPPASCGDSGHALGSNSSKNFFCQAITGVAAAGGSNTQIQFNNATGLSGAAGLTTSDLGATLLFSDGALKLTGATSGTAIIKGPATGGGTFTLPVSASDTIATLAATQTFTNKSISGSTNTVTNIPLSAFTNLGTTTTVLHGNAAGNPTFGAVSLTADVTGSLALSSLAAQAADTIVANATAGSASPTAVSLAALGGTNSCAGTSNALTYSNSTHAFGCNTISGSGSPGSTTGAIQYNNAGSFGGAVLTGVLLGNGTGAPTAATLGNNLALNSGVLAGTYQIRAVTTTSDTINCSNDGGKLVTYSNASAIAVTLPQATSTCGAGVALMVSNKGAGLVTVTPTTSTVNGSATLTVATNTSCELVSDGTNWQVDSCTSLIATGTSTIASGSGLAMGTSAISSGACATVVTATATGVATTDVVTAGFNGDPTAVTGYIPATAGMLTIISYPTANNVNFKVCNNTSSSITPGAISLNWRVVR